MRRIAYLTSGAYRGEPVAPGQVPGLDACGLRLIAEAGRARGLAFEVVRWDEPDLAARGYAAAIIRSCWDYTNRAAEFVHTLERHQRGGLGIHNSPQAVRWNARKTYLRELGADTIDTIWVEKADARAVAQAFVEFDAAEIVVKPQIGAGARETLRLKRNQWSEADLIGAPDGAAMIQPFLGGVETEGERSLFWFGGRFSHAIRKVPAPGSWLANQPGATRFAAEGAPPAAMETAERALGAAPGDLLYVRVDLVLGDDGRWRVIELEAIEPHLFLDLAPEGAGFFVDAVTRVLEG